MFDGGVVFGPKAAKRVEAVVKRVESTIYPSAPRQSKYPIISGSAIQAVDAIVTNAVSGFNANTNSYGSGSAQAVWPVLNTNSGLYQPGNYNSIGNVTVQNFSFSSGTIATNTHIKMIQQQTANGSLVWSIDWADCGPA